MGNDHLCQIQLQRWAKPGRLERPAFRMIGAPYTGYLTLAFLAAVLVMIFISPPWTAVVTAIVSALMVVGWLTCQDRIRSLPG